MNQLKTLIFNRYRILLPLAFSMGLSLVFLMVRMKLNHSFYFLFLVWNLFLAFIPFAITMSLSNRKKPHKIYFLFMFIVWLVLLPNAPYIITDLLYLHYGSHRLLWLDVLVILSFVINGLALYFLSLSDMEKLLKRFFNAKFTQIILIFIFGLTAFGVYLGRFLHYNSWEILNRPLDILLDIVQILFQPDMEAWAFTLTFASFLAVLYWLLKTFRTSHVSINEHKT